MDASRGVGEHIMIFVKILFALEAVAQRKLSENWEYLSLVDLIRLQSYLGPVNSTVCNFLAVLFIPHIK